MDWEQCGGEIKARLVAQGVYAKPRHWFSMQIILYSKCYKFLILSLTGSPKASIIAVDNW